MRCRDSRRKWQRGAGVSRYSGRTTNDVADAFSKGVIASVRGVSYLARDSGIEQIGGPIGEPRYRRSHQKIFTGLEWIKRSLSASRGGRKVRTPKDKVAVNGGSE